MATIEELKQDIMDLLDITNASRCKGCGRYYPEGYVCIHCGKDNSIPDEEEKWTN